jgi:subtilisin family serine protease
VGAAGTCPNCTLINVKVLDDWNKGDDARYVSAINWVAASGFDVINMSFGGYGKSTALETAINNAYNSGVVLVGAAGNDGNNGTEFYPAAFTNVIAVAATDSNDARATWDNTATTAFEQSNAGSFVDVAAPGKGILSTTPTYAGVSTCDGKTCYAQNYDYYQGTSMAAPHVSGLAGLILSKDASLSPAQVRNQIQSTAKDLGPAVGWDSWSGHGRIDAQAALKFTSRTYQEADASIAYNGASDWTKYSWSSASGGYTNWAYRAGATATFSFTGNSFSWWANKDSWAGRAYVYVDGYYQQTVDLYAPSGQPSQPVYTRNWPTSGTHTVKVYVEGTSGRPWVDVDRFTVTQRT